MAYKFTSEDKVDVERKEYLPFGVNDVKLVGATAGETESSKDFIELTVANADGVEDNARVWFTGGASPYSFQTIKQIVVHSAKTDADKEKARMAIENTVDTDEMVDLLNKRCVGGQLWVTKYLDPTRTYSNSAGEVKQSINTSIYGYEPKLKPELMPTETSGNAAVDSAFPGATKVDASEGIPSDDGWGK
jgi:hypothetical protein